MSSENLPLEIPNYTPEEITQLYRVMTPSEKKEFDELISGGRSAETLTLEAAGPETWLRTLGSRTFTGTFADFHYDLWEWYWRIAGKRRAEIPLTNQELVYLALWFRGAGKSSHVEWCAIAEGALVGTGYVQYICRKEGQAQEHVASIRQRIESENVARYYPQLANPKIGRHGNQYGWGQDFLLTAGGWAIRPIGLEQAVRGGKVGDLRVTLRIFDDIDNETDSPYVVEGIEKRIARSILPMGGPEAITLFAQNIISPQLYGQPDLHAQKPIACPKSGGWPNSCLQQSRNRI